MLEKTYQPADIEARIHAEWMKAEAFKAGRPERAKAEPYTIVIPPPNVTGSLHIGHALNNTLQDMLCRFERMRGKDVLWQPGTDHAGIATQLVVERQLAERQKSTATSWGARNSSRKCGKWKAECGGAIVDQLHRLGASCDWSRERFTMDEGLSQGRPQGVRRSLQRGADLQGQAPGQLGPACSRRAVSDLEVENDRDQGHLWHIKYPLEGRPGAASSPSPPRGPRPCWATRRWRCIRTMRATRR